MRARQSSKPPQQRRRKLQATVEIMPRRTVPASPTATQLLGRGQDTAKSARKLPPPEPNQCAPPSAVVTTRKKAPITAHWYSAGQLTPNRANPDTAESPVQCAPPSS